MQRRIFTPKSLVPIHFQDTSLTIYDVNKREQSRKTYDRAKFYFEKYMKTQLRVSAMISRLFQVIMRAKCVLSIMELNWNQRLRDKKTKLKKRRQMLTSSTKQQNLSFHVIERTRTVLKCTCKACKITGFFFVVVMVTCRSLVASISESLRLCVPLQLIHELFSQIARDSKDRLFTWGFGGYGRLGHHQPKDELIPRLVSFFKGKSKASNQSFLVSPNQWTNANPAF